MARSRLRSVKTKTPSSQRPPQVTPSRDLQSVTVVLFVIAEDLPSWIAVASFLRVVSAETDSARFLKSGIEMLSSIVSIPKVINSSSNDMPCIDFVIARSLHVDSIT